MSLHFKRHLFNTGIELAVPVCVQWPEAALRGVAAIQRGRARAAYPAAAAAAAAAFARHPAPLAGALHGYTPVLNTLPVDGSVYYDPFLAAHAADPRLQVLLKPAKKRIFHCYDILSVKV